jgi:hypothetical protein
VTRRPARTKLTTHVSPELAEDVQRLAGVYGTTMSATVEVLLAEALRARTEHQHAALLQAAVEQTIRETLTSHLGRIGDLAFRGALHSDELRRQMRPVLAQLLGQETARAVRRDAHSAAWQQLREPLSAPPDQKDGTWPDAPTPS